MITAGLVLVVALAFTIEGALGFGATLVAVTLGAFLVPVDALLPAFVPLNAVLSASIVVRAWRAVDRRLLVTRMVPLMALGMPVGMWASRTLDGAVLVKVFGAFVVVLAVFELIKRPLPLPGPLLMLTGGIVHGAFGTGGPLVVAFAGRALPDKAAFRATLSTLWLVLNVVLLAGWALDGTLTTSVLGTGAWLAVGLVVGMVAGEVAHRKVPASTFRVVVWAGLLVAGLALLAK